MTGYLNMPELTAQTLQDGWYHTRDLASFDEDGYLRIYGRMDNRITRGVVPTRMRRVVLVGLVRQAIELTELTFLRRASTRACNGYAERVTTVPPLGLSRESSHSRRGELTLDVVGYPTPRLTFCAPPDLLCTERRLERVMATPSVQPPCRPSA